MRREIYDKLVGKNAEKRAVLFSFESKQKLKEFYNSDAGTRIKESIVYLTEETSLEEKTSSDQITLFTRTFSRVTDFVRHDQTVTPNGGLHFIQSFLSEEFSEEKQIKCRIARQGDHELYSMILLDRDLEKFHIEKVHIEDVGKGKGLLSRISSTFTNVLKIEENKEAEGISYSRTVCIMDATCSMFHLLHKCKNTVDIMFERTSKILKDHEINSNSFQIQFFVYRNYNSREDKILQSSSWETKPHNLRIGDASSTTTDR
ncbi:unnamed protein product, partial [Rotaria sp. Silwood2]